MGSGIVTIHGREYKTVAYRVGEFREDHGIDDGWAIVTEEIGATNDRVKMVASIISPEGKVVATGTAEEQRDASQINKTSALENCETSAIGRALAAAGYSGSEYASANEVENAIHQQGEPPTRNPVDVAADQLIKDDADMIRAWAPGIQAREVTDRVTAFVKDVVRPEMENGADLYAAAKQRMSSVIDARVAEADGNA